QPPLWRHLQGAAHAGSSPCGRYLSPQAAFLWASNPQSTAPCGLIAGGHLQTVGSSPLRAPRCSRPPSGGCPFAWGPWLALAVAGRPFALGP
ncbi:hypothetical protein B296_00035233, partial [Ensete ventricosum]